MVVVLIILAVLLQFAFPIILALQVRRRLEIGWRVLIMGMLGYMGQSVAYGYLGTFVTGTDFFVATIQPSVLLYTMFSAALGSIFQVAALWVVFRYAGRDTHAPAGAAGVAVGYSLIDALFPSGISTLFNFISAVVFSVTGGQGQNATADDLAKMQASINQYWNQPAYYPVLTTLVIFFAMTLQFVIAAMVWTDYTMKKWLWLVAAALWGMAMMSASQISLRWLGAIISPVTGLSEGNEPLLVTLLLLVLMAVQLSLLYFFWVKIYPDVSKVALATVAEEARLEALKPKPQAPAAASRPAALGSGGEKKGFFGRLLGSFLGPAPTANKPQAPAAPPTVTVKTTKPTKPVKLPRKDE